MNKTYLFLFIISFLMPFHSLCAQDIYTDARELTLIGKGNPCPEYYHRVDTAKYNGMPAAVKRLYTNPAGMAITFKTNSNTIKARWSMDKLSKNHGNMTPIAHSGLDLYIRLDDKWTYAGSAVPKGLDTETTIVSDMEDGEKECLLYLPLYNELKELKIGTSADSYVKPLENPFKGKIVVYGSSITQGSSASRPGMAYLSQIARRSGLSFINLGVSGSGKMEPEVARMVADMDADVYVMDCAANPSPEQITERTANFVKIIRDKHPDTPIVMIQSVVREGGTFNTKIRNRVEGQNKAFKEEYEKLVQSGTKNIYLIESINFLGGDHEGSVDGIHPTDLGFDRFLEVVEPQLLRIIRLVAIKK